MTQKKLTTMLSVISEHFIDGGIPFCLIGAFALGFYGLPRHTVDIDFMIDADYWKEVSEILTRSGYVCYQKTETFAQFDSDYDIYGKVDLMLVNSEAGRAMMRRGVLIDAELIGNIYVIQPSDYIILKLLAIANNQERLLKDEFDIASFFKAYEAFCISDKFEKLDAGRIYAFAEQFGQTGLIKKYMTADG